MLPVQSLFRSKKFAHAVSAWEAAWLIVAPVGFWFVFSKLCKITYTSATWLGTGPESDTLRDRMQWIMGFSWPRFLIV